MNSRIPFAVFALLATPAFAHRVDEYLQNTIFSIDKDTVHAHMTLTPGIDVVSRVLALIDSDSNGVLSEPEQRAYATRVLRDLSLSIDGQRLTPQLLSVQFPAMPDLKEGEGDIQIDFEAKLPQGSRNRKLTFENRHQADLGEYLVNCTVPRDRDLEITAQNRNPSQSTYSLEFVRKDIDLGR